MSPGNIVRLKTEDEMDLFWEVSEVCIGGLGEESLVILRSINRVTNRVEGMAKVPIKMLENSSNIVIYKK